MSLINILVGALMLGSVYGVLAIGYSLLYKSSGLMNLAQGDFLMFGAFLGLTFYKFLKLPLAVSLLLTVIVMFLLGWFLQKGLIIPLLKKKGSKFASVILCTVAISMALQNGAMLLWGSTVHQFPPIFKTGDIQIFGTNITPESLFVLAIAIGSTFILYMFLNKTKFGTAIRAAALDEKAASALGIDVQSTKGMTWGISAALAGFIGAALGPVYGVYATMGALMGQKAFASAVMGGYGNIYGAMVGGLFFGFLETLIAAYVTTAYKDLISFFVLIIIMMFMPTGLFREKILE